MPRIHIIPKIVPIICFFKGMSVIGVELSNVSAVKSNNPSNEMPMKEREKEFE